RGTARASPKHTLWARYHRAPFAANLATFPRNDHVFAVSDMVAASIRYPGPLRLLPMPAVETLHHGVDPAVVVGEADGLRGELGIAADAPVIGSVANFKAAKDHATLLRATAHVRRAVPGVRLLLVGQGPLEAATRHLAAELGLEETVVFAGFRSDARRLAATFDVFTFFSTFKAFPHAP